MANEDLHRIVEQLEAAWNNGDSAGFAAPFADDADFVHILGGTLHRLCITNRQEPEGRSMSQFENIKFEKKQAKFLLGWVVILGRAVNLNASPGNMRSRI